MRPPTSPTTFPVRVAAIDVGSNAIRFEAAEFSEPTSRTSLGSDRAAVRLGASAFRSGELDPGSIERAVSALAGFGRRLEELGVERYRAVATSAVRESRNGRDLVRRALDEGGVRLEPITSRQEAELVLAAVQARLTRVAENWVLADLGGGSLEVSLTSSDGISATGSHPLGTLRILEMLGDRPAEPQLIRELLERDDALDAIQSVLPTGPVAGMIATGGNIEALADLAGPAANGVAAGDPVRAVPLERLRELIELLAGLSPAERMERWALREDRADVILPAALIYERVAHLARADRIVVPDVGVKEGILLTLASGRDGSPAVRGG